MAFMKLVMGTAALGLPYGLPAHADGVPALIAEDEARQLIHTALVEHIDTFDTAPAYGVAEQRLGDALGQRACVWTKLGHDRDWDSIAASLTRSCQRLRRERIDVVQIHNWQPDLPIAAMLDALRADPRVAMVGCSTYGVDAALSAVRDGGFGLVQVEWNLLNQQVVDAIGDEAAKRGVLIAVRSVLLQGVLSERPLPAHLAALGAARAAVTRGAQHQGMSLAQFAIASACGHPRIDRVLVGVDAPEQLHVALAAMRAPVSPDTHLHVGGPLTDPRTWKAPV